MKKVCVVLVLLLAMSVAAVSAATVKLDKDTEMHPQGWVAGSLMFKGGTEVVLNDKGEVISGVLKYREFIRPAGDANMGAGFGVPTSKNKDEIYFKCDNKIVFNERGEVIAGTLADNTNARIVKESSSFLPLKSDTYISFSSNGALITATIKLDTCFRPVGWEKNIKENAGFIKYKAGTEITFNNKGEVVASK